MKPRVKAGRINFHMFTNMVWYAKLDRLSYHPKLGPPRCESQSQTSQILRIDFEKKEMETLNTIYYWE